MIAQALLDTFPFGVLLTDADLRLEQINLWLVRRLALPADTLIGRPLGEAFPELNDRSLLAAYGLALNDRQTVKLPANLYTYFIRVPDDKSESPAAMAQTATIAPLVEAGRVVGTLTLIEDETQRLFNERQLQRQIDKMTALHEVDRALATLDLEACLQIIAERTRYLFGGHNSALLLRRDGKLEVAAATGYEPPILGFSLAAGEGITGWVVDHKVSAFAPDVRDDPRYTNLDTRTCSEMASPLLIHDECIGVINVESHDLDGFDAEDLDTMEWLAGRAAAAINNAQLHHAEREQRTLADTLRNIGLTLSNELNPDAILDILLDHVAQVVPYDSASVLMIDHRTGYVRMTRERGYDRFEAAASAPRFDAPMLDFWNLRRMAELLQPLVIRDTAADPRWVVTEISGHIQSWAGAPIVARGQLLGFLSLDHVTPNFYTQSMAERLAVFAAQAGLALENARLYAEQQRLATTDGLTGLANRRSFDMELARELQRADRHKRSTSLVMVDLDDFKQYNDRYGHPAGDDLLRAISVILGQCIRTLDTAARYGGEEFVLILPETPPEAAVGAAERLRKIVADLPLSPAGGDLPVTISLGVAVAPIHALTPTSLVKLADQALYAAKRAGKNRCCLYQPPLSAGHAAERHASGMAKEPK